MVMSELNHTHDAKARSWLASANGAGIDFPIQNLPLCVFRRAGSAEAFRGGIAIGDQVLDLGALANAGLLDGVARQAAQAAARSELNALFALGPIAWRALRHGVFALMREGADVRSVEATSACLVPLSEA